MKSALGNLRALFRRRDDRAAVPARFKFTVENYGPSQFKNTIELRPGGLWTKGSPTGLVIMPSPPRWRRFRAELDSIGVWAWRPTYENRYMIDGGGWALEIRYADRGIKSEGCNAWPEGDEPPRCGETPGEEDDESRPKDPFNRFCEAVSRLIPLDQKEAFG